MVGQTIIVPFDVLSQHLMMIGTPPSKEYKVRIIIDFTIIELKVLIILNCMCFS